jgi:branched-chain amino acid transport system substrate-binding protein
MKKVMLFIALLVAAMVLAACAPATEQPTAEATEEAAAVPAECAEAGACAVFAPGEPIVIGMAGPMSGDISAFGTDVSQAAQLAAEDAGELEGHPFVVNSQDDQGTPEGGAAVANLFVSDPSVVAVAGHMFSGATNAAMPIYETARIAMASPSATRIDLTQQGFTVFNRVVGNDKFQGALAAEFIYNTLGARKLALIHDGGAYGQALAERTRDVFTELGGEVVALEAITVGETDYSGVLTAIAALNPDALFFGGYTGEGAVLANQRGAVGLGEIPFVSDDGIYGTQFIDLAGANAEGVYCTSAGTPAASEAKAAFDAAYEERWGIATGQLSPYSWYGYDAANVLIAAIKQVAIVGGDGNLYIPREALIAAVRGTSGFEGISSTITCDATGECSDAGFSVYQVQDGAWVELPK